MVVEKFVEDCAAVAARCLEPADCVLELAPRMLDLLSGSADFLRPAHRRADATGYARNLIHASPDGSLSLYALVWQPDQWTPVHDHGSWGVVGVAEGVLEERSYMRLDGHAPRDTGLDLVRGSVVLLAPGTVTSFLPNPDHIHLTGVPAHRSTTVSLHLYGRQMSSFHVYDVEAGTRQLVSVAHNES